MLNCYDCEFERPWRRKHTYVVRELSAKQDVFFSWNQKIRWKKFLVVWCDAWSCEWSSLELFGLISRQRHWRPLFLIALCFLFMYVMMQQFSVSVSLNCLKLRFQYLLLNDSLFGDFLMQYLGWGDHQQVPIPLLLFPPSTWPNCLCITPRRYFETTVAFLDSRPKHGGFSSD